MKKSVNIIVLGCFSFSTPAIIPGDNKRHPSFL